MENRIQETGDRIQAIVFHTAAIILVAVFWLMVFSPARGEPLKVKIRDLARLKSACDNQLIGYGLVIGLAGTGDTYGSLQTNQATANMLQRMGINMGSSLSSQNLRLRNVASVMVTAKLPPFAKSGDRVDVVVSSLGDATGLVGGTLLLTNLSRADNEVFATAQGPLSLGEAGKMRYYPREYGLAARVPNGGLILKDMNTPVAENGTISLIINQPDFSTAQALVEAINTRWGPSVARVVDPATVVAEIPLKTDAFAFMAELEGMEIPVTDRAKVVINERTGTVVIGSEVRLSPVAISHGTIKIVIREASPDPQKEIKIRPRDGAPVVMIPRTSSLKEVVDALNTLGASPRELISVLQALKESGALKAELEIL